jgi:hypothetical protein
MNEETQYTEVELDFLENEAINFYRSNKRKEWSGKRIENHDESLLEILPAGIEKIRSTGGKLIANLLENRKDG